MTPRRSRQRHPAATVDQAGLCSGILVYAVDDMTASCGRSRPGSPSGLPDNIYEGPELPIPKWFRECKQFSPKPQSFMCPNSL